MSASELALRACAILLVGLALSPAWGQQASTREQELIRRLRQQVQQLQAEQSAQQQAAQRASADQAQSKTKLDAAAAQLRRTQQQSGEQARELDLARKELAALRQEQSALQAGADALKAELQATTQRLTELRTERTQLQARTLQRDTDFADLERRHLAQAQGLQVCIANNRALHALGKELLQRYVDKGVAETAAQVEPFLQLRRVALENLVQDYEDKLDRQVLKADAGAAGAVRAP